MPEGIRTYDNPSVSLRLTAPLHRGAFSDGQWPPLQVRCVGVDALIDPTAKRLLNIQIHHIFGLFLDEFLAGLHLFAHEYCKCLVGGHGVLQLDAL